MNPLTLEWIEKAEGDYQTAQRELRARKFPNFDSSAFHSQQCAEKYLKARLQEGNIRFPFTHDLAVLLALAIPVEPLWSGLLPSAKLLSIHAVKTRYPGSAVTRPDAKDMLIRCKDFRAAVRQSLGLKP